MVSFNEARHDHMLGGCFHRRDSYRGKMLPRAGIRDTREQSAFRASLDACVPVEVGRRGLLFQKKSSISEALPGDTKHSCNSLSLSILSSSRLVNLRGCCCCCALCGRVQRVENPSK